TPEEYEVMKTHTVRGANILRPIPQLKEMIPGIELHHEALDGRGYPFGLKGDEIPIPARIIAVADTFDAMTTNRPYQTARDADYALRIIRSLEGTKFDPKVVAALTTALEGGKIRIHRRRCTSCAGGGGGSGQLRFFLHIPRVQGVPKHTFPGCRSRNLCRP